MRYLILFISMVLAIMPKSDNKIIEKAETFANEYYSSFQQLSTISNPEGSEGKSLESKILKMAGSGNDIDVSAMNRIPNDIDAILGSKIQFKPSITINHYVGQFINYIINNRFAFTYKITSSRFLEHPSSFKEDLNEQFGQVVVEKTFLCSGKSTSVNDTMMISFVGNKIFLHSIRNSICETFSSDDMFAMALNKYTDRKYYEAFDLFEKVMAMSPRHERASYYLGVMLYKNQGCKKKYPTRYERDRKAVEYWKMSQLGRNAICYYSDGYDCD